LERARPWLSWEEHPYVSASYHHHRHHSDTLGFQTHRTQLNKHVRVVRAQTGAPIVGEPVAADAVAALDNEQGAGAVKGDAPGLRQAAGHELGLPSAGHDGGASSSAPGCWSMPCRQQQHPRRISRQQGLPWLFLSYCGFQCLRTGCRFGSAGESCV